MDTPQTVTPTARTKTDSARLRVLLSLVLFAVALFVAVVQLQRGEVPVGALLPASGALLVAQLLRGSRGAIWVIRIWALLFVLYGLLFWFICLLEFVEVAARQAGAPSKQEFWGRILSLHALIKTVILVVGIVLYERAERIFDYLQRPADTGDRTT